VVDLTPAYGCKNSVGLNIPKPIRDALKLDADDEVELIDKEVHVVLKPNEVITASR